MVERGTRKALLVIHANDYDGGLRKTQRKRGGQDTYFVYTYKRVNDAKLKQKHVYGGKRY